MTYKVIDNITDNDLIKLATELASIKDKEILQQEIHYILDCGAHGLRSVLLEYCAARLDKTNEKTKHLKKHSE